MTRTIEASNLKVSPRDGIPVGGRTIRVTFDGRKFLGSGLLQARYEILPGDPFFFRNPRPDRATVAFLAPAPVGEVPTPYSKTLVLAKKPGGRRLFRLDIKLVVEEVDDAGDVISAETIDHFHIPIKRGTSARLAEARGNLGLSQAELAAMLGVSRSTISRIEAGGNPSRETLRKLPRTMEELGE